MPELHNFLKQHPNKKEKFEAMLDLALGASKYKLFIKRKLQNLAEAGTTALIPNSKCTNLKFTMLCSDLKFRRTCREQADGIGSRRRVCVDGSTEQWTPAVARIATASRSATSHPSRRRRRHQAGNVQGQAQVLCAGFRVRRQCLFWLGNQRLGYLQHYSFSFIPLLALYLALCSISLVPIL